MAKPILTNLALWVIAMLIACDISLPSRAKISFRNDVNQFISLDMLDVLVSKNGHERHFTTDDFGLENVTGYFATGTSGEITAFVKIRDGDITVAEGSITNQLIEDYSLNIIIVLSAVRPDYGCFGCGRYAGFPIDPAYIDSTVFDGEVAKFDSMYIMLAGNWITNPVDY